ncbi:MAG: hypothetical protein K6T73_10200 [Candidatus Bathyarchaeota archaeon]|nr:hypothetical protein [Candidatus Bathyarchaeota archaeon]
MPFLYSSTAILFADNTTYPTSTWILHDGRLAMLLMRSQPGNHTCVFNPESGYVFAMRFPKLMQHLSNKLVHVVFEDLDTRYTPEPAPNYVWKRFSFG